MEDSKVVLGDSGAIGFIGRDAVDLFRARQVRLGLKLSKSGMQLTRRVTKKLLELASEYSQKKYKMSQVDDAMKDMDQWIAAMEAAMPIVDERKNKD